MHGAGTQQPASWLSTFYAIIERSGPARVHLPTPRECWNHLRQMFAGQVARVAGHNPLGAAMSVLLWSLILFLALSGWISRWDRFWGADWPRELHAWLSVALQASVVLHLTGVAISSALERQNGQGHVTGTSTGSLSGICPEYNINKRRIGRWHECRA